MPVTHGKISGPDDEGGNPGGNDRQGGLPQPIFPYGICTAPAPFGLLVRRPFLPGRSPVDGGNRSP